MAEIPQQAQSPVSPETRGGAWSDVQALFDATPVPIYAKDLDGHYRACNRAFAALIGRTVPEVLGLHTSDVAPPELAVHYLSSDAELYARGGTQLFEAVVEVHGGERRTVVFHKALLPGQGGVVRGLVGTLFDITEQRAAQASLRLSEEKLSKLFHTIPDTIVLTRAGDGRLLDVNRGFEEATGYSRQEALDSSTVTLSLWADLREREEMVAELRQGGVVSERDFTFRRKDGSLRSGSYSARTFQLAGELCMVFVMRDVTEQKRLAAEHRRLEEQVRHGQKLEAVGQVAGGVAHDFNNLLTVQLGALGLLDELALPDEARELLAELRTAAQAAAELTRQLLAFSRRQVLQKRVVSLNEVLHGFARLLRRILPESVTLEVEPAPEPGWVEGDVGAIDQVLMNLSVNARDAMPHGGRLTLRIDSVELPRGQTAGPEVRGGRFVRLAVLDTGEGIPPGVRERIFEPFFTTKPVGLGTGLGLATVYGITRQHDGWIELESEVGKGTAFHVYFPEAAPPGPVEPVAALAGPQQGRGETVLLVEDAPSVRRMFSSWLGRLGYRVIEAANGAAALARWREPGARIDLLLTDVVMPGAPGGIELVRALRAQAPGLPAVITSGYSADLAAEGLPPDAGFLPKPWTPESLAQVLREQLSRGRTQQ